MSQSKSNAIYQRQVEARNKLWPNVANYQIWYRLERDGFVTMPRAMPLIMKIMDHLAGKGVPVSQVYLDIWCRSFDEGFVQLNRADEMSYYSGFSGQRALRTWKDRINRLAELGFIDLKAGPSGPISYALLYNPYHVIARANSQGLLLEGMWEALIIRVSEIGADDLDNLDENGVVKPPSMKQTLAAISRKSRQKTKP